MKRLTHISFYFLWVYLWLGGMACPAFAGMSFSEWVHTPLTKWMTGVLLLFCMAGLVYLILQQRKNTRIQSKDHMDSLIESKAYAQLLDLYKDSWDKDPAVIQKLADAMATDGVDDTVAIKIYERSCKEQPSSQKVIQQLARSYARLQRTDVQALEIYKKAMDTGVHDPGIIQLMAYYYIDKKQWEPAKNLLTELVNAGYTTQENLNQLASCLLKMNSSDAQAFTVYRQTVETNPTDTSLVLPLATLYADKGMTDEHACEIYEQALKLKPDLQTVRLILCKVYLQQKKLAACIEHCQYFNKKGLFDKNIQELLAGVYVETHQWTRRSLSIKDY